MDTGKNSWVNENLSAFLYHWEQLKSFVFLREAVFHKNRFCYESHLI